MFKRRSLATKTNYTYRVFPLGGGPPLEKKCQPNINLNSGRKINTGISFKACTWRLMVQLAYLILIQHLNSEKQQSLLCWRAETHPCCRLLVCVVVREGGDGIRAGLQAGERLHFRAGIS